MTLSLTDGLVKSSRLKKNKYLIISLTWLCLSAKDDKIHSLDWELVSDECVKLNGALLVDALVCLGALNWYHRLVVAYDRCSFLWF